ncbi:MAG: universal stress protein, partial [Chloroflexi bacterium]|nr:universal stress protein [Chloroflexota bacterium]
MSTYGTILVPLDGSGLALRALPFAKDIARSTGARLVLAYALAPWELPIDMPPQVRSAANELLSSGVDVRVHLCPPRVGSAGRSLVEAADEERAGLIIMATHAHGEVGRTLLGSVADYVVRHASVPVLVLTESSELRWSSGRPQRVLVPLDGSARSEVALEEAVHIAEFSGATLLLLRVADFQAVVDGAEPAGVSFQMEQLLIETRHYLDGLMTRLNDGHIEAEMLAAVGSPELAIPEAVRDRRADLVVMSTHGG